MDINELYQGISNFWERISPLLYFHFATILVLIGLYGNNWYILERIEHFLLSERYTRWKKILDEFSMRPVIPYLMLIVFFAYLSLLNNVLGVFGGFGPFSIVYSQTEFWRENRPLDKLVEVASYQTESDIKVWEIYNVEQKFLEEYKAQYPQKYNSLSKWIWDDFGAWLKYYQLSLLFLILVVILAFNQVRNRDQRAQRLLKLIGIVFLTLVAVVFFRVKAEQNIEKSLNAELDFVVAQLRIDPKQKKMSDTELAFLECSFYLDLANSTGYTLDNFWVSKLLEKGSFISREMPSITDIMFVEQNRNLEYKCKQSP